MTAHGDSFPIVGIGASAGGVEALSRLFELLPPGLAAAFVVITHLPRHRDSMLPEILARFTAMPMAAAVDGQKIEAGHVYLNSPDTILTIADDRFVLTERSEERNPIDIMLGSLAASAPLRAIAVILSGTGTDGALGVKAVREAGGLTLAQRFNGDPSSHHGMPEAAVATGFVDAVLPIHDLSVRLTEYIGAFGSAHLDADPADAAARAQLAAEKRELCAILQERVGHDFSGYKSSTFMRRLRRRMQVRGIAELPGYIAFLRAQPEEADLFFRELLIGVTSFFRDAESYEALATLVIPRLFEGHDSDDTIRVWVPGCSTGEEAYSIAMLLREGIGTSHVRLQIFASDVDENALAIARLGRYPARLLDGLSPERVARYFVSDGAGFAVSKEIRDICMFSCHSLIRDPPFSRVDLISCRNLLIYLNQDVQKQVIPVFHYALRAGGFLFLGSSEHATQRADLFEPLDKKHRIFRRLDLPARPTIFPVPYQPGAGQRAARLDLASAKFRSPSLVALGQSVLLDQYAPAHIIVNRQGDVLHFSVRTGKYLEPPYGSPSRNLLAMVRPGLALPLRSVLHEAMEGGPAVRRDDVVVQTEAGPQTISLSAQRLDGPDGEAAWLVVFTDVGPVSTSADRTAASTISSDRDQAFQHLEQELAETRQRLDTTSEEAQIAVAELKTTNEELQSANEELQSANEELETSKEELQSVNEELHTVNSELSDKVAELDRTTSDIRNLFDSTQVATLFLDSGLAIRAFTPAVNAIFKLFPGDRGRSILDFGSTLEYGDLAADVRTTLATAAPLERKLVSRDGATHYLMRVLPYRKADGQIDGVILTFVNVTSLVELGQQQALVAELNHRVKNVLAVVGSIAVQLARRCTTMQEFSDGFTDRIAGLARTHDILSRNDWAGVALSELVTAELHAFVTDAGRLAVGGPGVHLSTRAATTLGIALHELATNAVKYGALSVAPGRLSVTWTFETRGEAKWVVLVWRESGGPPVRSPARKGFGTQVIGRSLEYDFAGSADFRYQPDGLVVTLAMPMEHLTGAG